MAQVPEGKDPLETIGLSGEVNPVGVYVFQRVDENDEKIGDKLFLEASDPAAADAFIRQGWKLGSTKDVAEYKKRTEAAHDELRDALTNTEENK